MAVEEELKKDHSDMQAVVDSKQMIIEAQVRVFYRERSQCQCPVFLFAFTVKGHI